MDIFQSIFAYSALAAFIITLVEIVGMFGFILWTADRVNVVNSEEEQRIGKVWLLAFVGFLALATAIVFFVTSGSVTESPRVWALIPAVPFFMFPILHVSWVRVLKRTSVTVAERTVALRYRWAFTLLLVGYSGALALFVMIYNDLNQAPIYRLLPLFPLLCVFPQIERFHRAVIRNRNSGNHSLILGEGQT